MIDTIKIGGVERQIVLKKSVVDKFVKLFNTYYALQTKKFSLFETEKLLEIESEPDQEKQVQMVDEYVKDIEKKYESIEFPYFIIYDILWEILPPKEQENFPGLFFRSSKRKMIKEILIDELDTIVTFIGAKVLRLAGYNKKKL